MALRWAFRSIEPLSRLKSIEFAMIKERVKERLMPTTPIRILSVEDHPVFRQGLSTIIGSEQDMILIAQATNATEAIKEFRAHLPDVTLMDLRLPGASGTDALIAIRGEYPSARVIVLTTSEGDAEIRRAVRAGASGYLLKSTPADELVAAIRAVHAGQKRVSPEVAAEIAEHAIDDGITPREIDVLRLIAAGNSNKEIAAQLSLTEDSAKGHVKNILAKLGVNDRTHAVTIALKRGFISL